MAAQVGSDLAFLGFLQHARQPLGPRGCGGGVGVGVVRL
jgi:hypothetical protein